MTYKSPPPPDDGGVAAPGIPQGFTTKMLESMPSFVTGLIGSFLGIAISIVIVLKLGGMDVAFSRVVNAYATALETRLVQTQVTADNMAAAFERLDVKLKEQDEAIVTLQSTSESNGKRLETVEKSARALGDRLEDVEKWACGIDSRGRGKKPSELQVCGEL